MFSLDRQFVDENILASEEEIAAVTTAASEGTISIEEWQETMESILYTLLIAIAALARDGENDLAIWGVAQRWLSEQYAYLDNFADELRRGRYDEADLKAVIRRAQQYPSTARVLYETIRMESQRAKGLTQKRRNLEPRAKHCPDCMEQAALEWVDIDDPRVTPIGVGVRCGMGDLCTIIYQ